MAAHEVGIGVGVDLEQVGGVALHGHDPLGDPGVASSTRKDASASGLGSMTVTW